MHLSVLIRNPKTLDFQVKYVHMPLVLLVHASARAYQKPKDLGFLGNNAFVVWSVYGSVRIYRKPHDVEIPLVGSVHSSCLDSDVFRDDQLFATSEDIL